MTEYEKVILGFCLGNWVWGLVIWLTLDNLKAAIKGKKQ